MLDKLINQTWKTSISANTGNQGTVSFRGFFGEYDIVVSKPDGNIEVFPVHVSKKEENKWVFTTH